LQNKVINRIILIAFLLLFFTATKAANPDSPYFRIVCDTIPFKPNSDMLFCLWDSLNLNPYKLNLSQKKDTTWIKLNNDTDKFYFPVLGKVNSPFGWRSGRIHSGVDLQLNLGDSVSCVSNGMVRFARYYKGYGYLIIVSHDNGIETMYAHLSKMLVHNGEFVKGGQIIGLGGATGRATGYHLHFETRFMGQAFNPALFMDFNNKCLKEESLPVCAATFGYIAEVAQVKYHTVKSGDTLYAISKKYGVSIDKLCKLNKITRSTVLQIGRKLRYS